MSHNIKNLDDLPVSRSLEEELAANRNSCPMVPNNQKEALNETHAAKTNHLKKPAIYSEKEMENFNEITSFRSPIITSTSPGELIHSKFKIV